LFLNFQGLVHSLSLLVFYELSYPLWRLLIYFLFTRRLSASVFFFTLAILLFMYLLRFKNNLFYSGYLYSLVIFIYYFASFVYTLCRCSALLFLSTRSVLFLIYFLQGGELYGREMENEGRSFGVKNEPVEVRIR